MTARLAAWLFGAVVSAGCTRALPIDPHWTGTGCYGTGTDMVIHGSLNDPNVTWVTRPDGSGRVEIIWPLGHSARVVPSLEVVDTQGEVVAHEGDRLRGWCKHAETPEGVPIWVEGRDVEPASPQSA